MICPDLVVARVFGLCVCLLHSWLVSSIIVTLLYFSWLISVCMLWVLHVFFCDTSSSSIPILLECLYWFSKAKTVYKFIELVIYLCSIGFGYLLPQVILCWFWMAFTCHLILVIMHPMFVTCVLELLPLWSPVPYPLCFHAFMVLHLLTVLQKLIM